MHLVIFHFLSVCRYRYLSIDSSFSQNAYVISISRKIHGVEKRYFKSFKYPFSFRTRMNTKLRIHSEILFLGSSPRRNSLTNSELWNNFQSITIWELQFLRERNFANVKFSKIQLPSFTLRTYGPDPETHRNILSVIEYTLFRHRVTSEEVLVVSFSDKFDHLWRRRQRNSTRAFETRLFRDRVNVLQRYIEVVLTLQILTNLQRCSKSMWQ